MAKTGPKSKYDTLIGSVRIAYDQEGMTDVEISETLNIPVDTIYAWRMKAGIKSTPRPTKYTKPSREVLLQAWKDSVRTTARGGIGTTTTQGSAIRVGEALGVPSDTVKKWLKEEGILEPRKMFKTHGPEAVRLYVEEGLPVYKVAETMGLLESTVSTWLKKSGVKVLMSEHRRTDDDRKKIKKQISVTKIGGEMYDLFQSADDVLDFARENGTKTSLGLAKKLGVSSFFTDNRLKELGIWDEFDHVSSLEDEIHEMIKSWGFTPTRNTRKIIAPYEIDIFIPERNVGIEFNGSYWHSELHKERSYHAKKSKMAEMAGVRLIHIWEYDWESKKEQYLSIIRNALGINDRKIGARTCVVREIDAETKKRFLEANHFQGNDAAQVRLGLFCGDELVSVMTFGRARFVKGQSYDFELLRFCSLAGVNVQGGASKLFAHFCKMHPDASVISYSDNGRTSGSLYRTLGFELSHDSAPSYVWVDPEFNSFLTRYQTQMKDEANTMQAEGYLRVYNAGSKVWTYNMKETR